MKKRKQLSFLLIILVMFQTSYSAKGVTFNDHKKDTFLTLQTPSKVWDQVFGGLEDERFSAVIEASDGSLVAIGQTNSATSGEIYDGNNGDYDGLIVKFDANGNYIWDQVFGGSGNDGFSSFIETNDGGYIVVGRTLSSNSGEIQSQNNGGSDGLIVKFDANGNYLWDQVFGGANDEYFESIVETDDGSFVVVGSTTSSNSGEILELNNGKQDGMLVKFDALGNVVWTKLFGGSEDDWILSLDKTVDSGFIVAGNTYSSQTGNLKDTNNGGGDALLVKFDKYGNILWDKMYGNQYFENFHSVIQSSDGGFIGAGRVRVDTGTVITNPKGIDGLIVKFDPLGNPVWSKNFGGSGTDWFQSVTESPISGYVLTGYTEFSVNSDFDDFYISSADGLIVNVDSQGNKIWDNIFGGDSYDELLDMTFTKNGDYIFVGYTNSSGTGEINDTNNRFTDGLITKLANNSIPTITLQPSSQTVFEGDLVILRSQASGVPFPTVQWQVSLDGGNNWDNIEGANNEIYSFKAELNDSEKAYRAIFTNVVGYAETNFVLVSIVPRNSLPIVSYQPNDVSVEAGDVASFSSTAVGYPEPTIQWQESYDDGLTWMDVEGATTNVYAFTADLNGDGNLYRAKFENLEGQIFSSVAKLTVTPKKMSPYIIIHPSNIVTTEGELISFYSKSGGYPTPSIRWQVSKDQGITWQDILGEINESYDFIASLDNNGNLYRAVFTNSEGVAESRHASLIVEPLYIPIVITLQPSNQRKIVGESVVFSIEASGSPMPSIQWEVSTDDGLVWKSIDGENSKNYSFVVEKSDSGSLYRAKLTNYYMTTYSDIVKLTVDYDAKYDGIFNVESKNSGMVMDVYGGGTTEGTNIIQYSFHGMENQQWKFESLNNGYYKITSVLNPEYSIDVYGGGDTMGNRVIQYHYHGGTNQQWKILENADGSISLMSRLAEENGTRYLLDVYDGGRTEGVNVIQWAPNGGDNQKWFLQPVASHSVTFNSNGGTEVKSVFRTERSLIAEPVAPVKEGMVFDGWYKDEALTLRWNFASDRIPTTDITLYAKWVADYSGTYIIRSKNSNLVMDVYGGGTTEGTNIIQYSYHGMTNQQWKFESLNNGYYKITSVLNPEYSIDVYGGGTTMGNRVIQYHYHGGINQQWKILENADGSISLMSRLAEESGTGYLLDVFGGGKTEGVNVIQWVSNNGDNQKWYLEILK